MNSLIKPPWRAWDQANVLSRMIGYKEYHQQRDGFFLEAVPPEARAAGYRPEIESNFKPN